MSCGQPLKRSSLSYRNMKVWIELACEPGNLDIKEYSSNRLMDEFGNLQITSDLINENENLLLGEMKFFAFYS